MINKFIISGDLDNQYGYTAIYFGKDISRETYFYDQLPKDKASIIRFFSKGNQITLKKSGIEHSGNGGTFCEYMFGINIPLGDLIRPNVLNRLILYGAYIPAHKNSLIFTDSTDGFENYTDIFEKGHAIHNWFFFISSPMTTDLIEKQRWILKHAGRFLKTTPLAGSNKPESYIQIADALIKKLPEENIHVFLLKLTDKINAKYCNAVFKNLKTDPSMSSDDWIEKEKDFPDLRKQVRERIKMDAIYRFKNNKKILDTYKMILVESHKMGKLPQETQNYIFRYKNLLKKKNIPMPVYSLLEQKFPVKIVLGPAEDYITEFRLILSNLFFTEYSFREEMLTEALKPLILAKHRGFLENNKSFEQILIDLGKKLDEIQNTDFKIKQIDFFSQIVTYFDIYDSSAETIANYILGRESKIDNLRIKSLLRALETFEQIEKGFFKELFVDPLLKNPHLPTYGLHKLNSLIFGLEEINKGIKSTNQLSTELSEILEEEVAYSELTRVAREVSKWKSLEYASQEEKSSLLSKIADKVKSEKSIESSVIDRVFSKVIQDYNLEAVYFSEILPSIILTGSWKQRDEFIRTSGLDIPRIEEIENIYCEKNNLANNYVKNISHKAG